MKSNRVLASLVLFSIVNLVLPGAAVARIPNDAQWTQDGSMPLIHLPDAWDYTTGTSNVTVAVIDTGIDIANPDLIDNIWTNPQDKPDGIDNDKNGYIDDVHGWNFFNDNADVRPDPTGNSTRIGVNHGTVVAGIIGASGDNGIGSAGVNWHVRLMPLKILDNNGDGDSDLAVKAIDYAIQKKVDIINLSFVGPTPSLNFIQAIRRAYRAGILVVAAGGNAPEGGKGSNLNNIPQYPVCFDDPLKEENWVFGVGALNDAGILAAFSNFGDHCIDISAPGSHIASTVYFDPGQGYRDVYGGSWSGTSIAAPFVSGVAALVKSIQPTWGPDEIRKAILINSDPIPGNDTRAAGGGSLNALKTVRYALQGGDGGLPAGVFLNVTQTKTGAAIHVIDSAFKDTKTFPVSTKRVSGAINVTSADINGTGVANIIATVPDAQGTYIKIFQRDGKLIRQFRPFGAKVRGALSIEARDLHQNGRESILIGDAATDTVTVFAADGTKELSLHVPQHGSSMYLTTLRKENNVYIVTAVQKGAQTTVYVWDTIGSFVSTFTIAASGEAEIGVTDREGNGTEVLYFGTQSGKNVSVATYDLQGTRVETIQSQVPKGRVYGFTFAFVKGVDANKLIVAVQDGSNVSYSVLGNNGAIQSSTVLKSATGNTWKSMSFGK